MSLFHHSHDLCAISWQNGLAQFRNKTTRHNPWKKITKLCNCHSILTHILRGTKISRSPRWRVGDGCFSSPSSHITATDVTGERHSLTSSFDSTRIRQVYRPPSDLPWNLRSKSYLYIAVPNWFKTSVYRPPSDPPRNLTFLPSPCFDFPSPDFGFEFVFFLKRLGIKGGFSSFLLFIPGIEKDPTSGSSPTSFLKYRGNSLSKSNLHIVAPLPYTL